jgi:hypothetical protein
MKKPKITAKVSRGPETGVILEPHRYANGKYVVSRSRFAKDQVFVDYQQTPVCVRTEGMSLRMSNPVTQKNPTLKAPNEITIEE